MVANGYWPVTGLSQKFFLMMSPDGNRQMSLALMYRGEQLIYSIVGENGRVVGEKEMVEIPMVNGIAYDLKGDPNAGRQESLLGRVGTWTGELQTKRAGSTEAKVEGFEQVISLDGEKISERWCGNEFLNGDVQMALHSNGLLSWSEEGDFVGSHSSYGGRALSGQFHYLPNELRVWRREVVSADGLCKAVVNTWYEGEQKIADQWGMLQFRANH